MIERIQRPDYETFRDRFLARNRPVVISGSIDHWPAMRLWDFDYVGRALGDRAITPVRTNGYFQIDVKRGVPVEEMNFATYRRAIEGAKQPRYYLRLALEGSFKGTLAEDYDHPVYCSRRILLKKNLWLGGEGASVGLHYDMTHNIVAQITGRRKVLLFSPEDSSNLYPYPMRTLCWHHSQVSLDAPDVARFPRFRDARPIESELGRGELLFIPQGWWHRFVTIENAIAVNFFWLTLRLAPALAAARMAWVLSGVRT